MRDAKALPEHIGKFYSLGRLRNLNGWLWQPFIDRSQQINLKRVGHVCPFASPPAQGTQPPPIVAK